LSDRKTDGKQKVQLVVEMRAPISSKNGQRLFLRFLRFGLGIGILVTAELASFVKFGEE